MSRESREATMAASDEVKVETVHLWSLDDGCEHVIAAVDEATARKVGAEQYAVGDGGDPVSCEQIADDYGFTLWYPDGLEPPFPPGAVVDNELRTVSAPASVWAAFCGNGVYVGGEEC